MKLLNSPQSLRRAVLTGTMLATSHAIAGHAGPVTCDKTALQQVVSNATLTTAALLNTADGGTPYCRVDGYVITQGPGPNSNQVKFMVSLPADFNQRYYFIGLGGAAGFVPNPPDALLKAGYAVAGSNAGVNTSILDWSFAIDRTQAFDYAQRGVHVSSVATQEVTRAYYGLNRPNQGHGRDGRGAKKLYRYIDGCSGGGRMGNVAAMWYPEDFDGTILGAPGINTGNVLLFGKIAKFVLDNPAAWISPAQFAQFEQAIVARFDNADSANDDLVATVFNQGLDPASLGIFTAPQLQTLQLILGGLNGGATYPGYPLANPIGWSSFLVGTTPPPWSFNPADADFPPAGFLVFDSQSRGLYGLNYDFTQQLNFNNPAQVAAWAQKYEEVFIGSGTANPADLKPYLNGNGKILLWHGVADNAISVKDSLRYYNQLAQANGGLQRTAKSARLFLAPGMLHCAGGIGPQDVPEQALAAITRWVERGEAPNSLIAHRVATPTLPERSFLLCPYPQQAVFKGGIQNSRNLDVNAARNWYCAQPNGGHGNNR